MSLMSQGEIRIFTCLKEFIGHLSQFYFSEFIVASLKKKNEILLKGNILKVLLEKNVLLFCRQTSLLVKIF